MRDYDMMVAGHLCLDIIPRFPGTGARALSEILQPGAMAVVGKAAISTGGVVSNTGIALKRLGNRVCFSARIGDDEFGRLILACLEKTAGTQGIRVVPGADSSYTVIVAPPGIDRCFLHNPGANDEYSAADVDASLVERCRIFHFGYPPIMRRMYEKEGAGLLDIFRLARQAGATTSCDMAVPDPASVSGKAPWRHILQKVLPYVDLCLPSVEEAFYALDPEKFLAVKAAHPSDAVLDHLPPERYSSLGETLVSMGAKVVALKAGDRGFYLRTGGKAGFPQMGEAKPADFDGWDRRELWAPPFRAGEIASAVGAGDCAVAGFLTAFGKGLGVGECLRYANLLGWENLQAIDATGGVRSWEDTVALSGEGLPVVRLGLDSSGWRWDATAGVWLGPADSRR